jgi:hypothetical protein
VPAPTTTVYDLPGVTDILFFQPSPPPPPPAIVVLPVYCALTVPEPPPPTHTTHTLVIPAGAVQLYVPGVVYACCPVEGGGVRKFIPPSNNIPPVISIIIYLSYFKELLNLN